MSKVTSYATGYFVVNDSVASRVYASWYKGALSWVVNPERATLCESLEAAEILVGTIRGHCLKGYDNLGILHIAYNAELHERYWNELITGDRIFQELRGEPDWAQYMENIKSGVMALDQNLVKGQHASAYASIISLQGQLLYLATKLYEAAKK